MAKPIVPLQRFPRKLGDDAWLRKKLAEINSPEHQQMRRDYLGVWTNQPEEHFDGPHRKTDSQV